MDVLESRRSRRMEVYDKGNSCKNSVIWRRCPILHRALISRAWVSSDQHNRPLQNTYLANAETRHNAPSPFPFGLCPYPGGDFEGSGTTLGTTCAKMAHWMSHVEMTEGHANINLYREDVCCCITAYNFYHL